MTKTVKKDKNKNTEKHSKARKIYNIVSSIIVAFVFIFMIFSVVLIITTKTNGNKPIFGKYIFDVVSGSMEPTIMVHDNILCEVVDPNTLEVGDIITFTAPSGPLEGNNITHRITYISYKSDGTINYIETRGDASKTGDNDPWKLPPNQVIARYVKTLHGLGEFRQFLLTPAGYIVLVFIPLLTCGILFIVSFVKDHTKKIIEKENAQKHVELNDLSDEEKEKLLKSIDSHESQNKTQDENSENSKNK